MSGHKEAPCIFVGKVQDGSFSMSSRDPPIRFELAWYQS